jgi:RimJ/RimL family protein N-acetyltransferase
VEYPSIYPVVVEGERIRLRDIGPADTDEAMGWATDESFFRYMTHKPVANRDEEEAYLRGLEKTALEQPRRHYHLGVEWKDPRALIGIARISISGPDHASADIGYGLRTDRWGQGIAPEAAALLLAFGFDTLGLHRIWAWHEPANAQSGRVMEKIGMQREGLLRENIYDGTRWRNSVLYAIVADDYWR